MPAITITVASLYVAQKCLDQLIKDEGYGRLKLLFFPKTKYINRLIIIIDKTISEYEKQNSHNKSEGKIAFYQSKVLFEELLKYLLFKSIDSNSFISFLKEDERIQIPSKIQLEKFFELFVSKVNADTCSR